MFLPTPTLHADCVAEQEPGASSNCFCRELFHTEARDLTKSRTYGDLMAYVQKLQHRERPHGKRVHSERRTFEQSKLVSNIIRGSAGHLNVQDYSAMLPTKPIHLLLCATEDLSMAPSMYLSKILLATHNGNPGGNRSASGMEQLAWQGAQQDVERFKVDASDQQVDTTMPVATAHATPILEPLTLNVESTSQHIPGSGQGTCTAPFCRDAESTHLACHVPDAVGAEEAIHKSNHTRKFHAACSKPAAVKASAELVDATSQQEKRALSGSKQASCPEEVKALTVKEICATSRVTSILELMKATEVSLKCSMALSVCGQLSAFRFDNARYAWNFEFWQKAAASSGSP